MIPKSVSQPDLVKSSTGKKKEENPYENGSVDTIDDSSSSSSSSAVPKNEVYAKVDLSKKHQSNNVTVVSNESESNKDKDVKDLSSNDGPKEKKKEEEDDVIDDVRSRIIISKFENYFTNAALLDVRSEELRVSHC